MVPLTGDASDRRYFRVHIPDEGSQVLAVHPGPIEFRSMTFVRVADLLSLLPVPIPAILSYSNELGIISLEDLGDVTLQAHLGAATPTEHKALYRQAVTLIETLQRRGAEMDLDATFYVASLDDWIPETQGRLVGIARAREAQGPRRPEI